MSDRLALKPEHLPGKVQRTADQHADRFRATQVGAVRSGLTLAQDGAGLVLTDNYLRVRLAQAWPGNERVRVRITGAGETMAGELVAPERAA